MDKYSIVFRLVREGKITDDEAKVLLDHWYQPYYYGTPQTPYVYPPYTYSGDVFCGTGAVDTTTASASTVTNSGTPHTLTYN